MMRNPTTHAVAATLALITLLAAVIPQYNVWRRGLRGKSMLREAEWTRQIAELDAQAEVERAKGVAQANQIIGDSLEGNEDYLRYRWIEGLHNGSGEVIYVPTEAGLPILEAGKR